MTISISMDYCNPARIHGMIINDYDYYYNSLLRLQATCNTAELVLCWCILTICISCISCIPCCLHIPSFL